MQRPAALLLLLAAAAPLARPAPASSPSSGVKINGRQKAHGGGPAETCPSLTYCSCRRTRTGGLDITCDKINRYKLKVTSST